MNSSNHLISLPARFKIIGVETIGVGMFLLLTFLADMQGLGGWLPSINSDFPIIGAALIFIGFEIMSLVRHLPKTESAKNNPTGRKIISVRELVKLDLALHGKKFILIEFGVAAPALLAAGLFILFRGNAQLGLYLFLLGLNYIPLFLYGVKLGRQVVRGIDRNQPDVSRMLRKFGIMQFLILIPFSILILSVMRRSTDEEYLE